MRNAQCSMRNARWTVRRKGARRSNGDNTTRLRPLRASAGLDAKVAKGGPARMRSAGRAGRERSECCQCHQCCQCQLPVPNGTASSIGNWYWPLATLPHWQHSPALAKTGSARPRSGLCGADRSSPKIASRSDCGLSPARGRSRAPHFLLYAQGRGYGRIRAKRGQAGPRDRKDDHP